MVKNAVIVPTGSKGGFYAKQLPDPTVDRDAWLAEGIGSYKVFISGLLDLTDNRVGGADRRPCRRWSATTPTTPTSWSRPTRARRPSPTSPTASPSPTASGSTTPSPPAGQRRLRPQGHGHHGPRRLGVGQAALPRDGRRHPDGGLHRGRHRRHVRRRLRQRHAALRAHPAGRRLRPPAHLHRPESRCGDVLPGAPAAVRAAPLVVGGLRHRADQCRRRGVRPDSEVGAGHPRDGRGPRAARSRSST